MSYFDSGVDAESATEGVPHSASNVTKLVAKKDKREDWEGKRWVRRKENGSLGFAGTTRGHMGFTDGVSSARFVGNPHVVAATKNDYQIPCPT